MKKTILLLSLAFISLEAKIEIKDIIKDDGSSYKNVQKETKKPVVIKKETPKVVTTKKEKSKVITTKKETPKVVTTKKTRTIKKESRKNFSKKEIKRIEEKNKNQKKEKGKDIKENVTPKKNIKELLSLNSNEIAINKTIDVKTKKTLFLNDTYLESITSLVRDVWNKTIFHSGEAKITLIMNTKKGKLEKIFIMNKVGSKDFKLDFKVFMRSLSKKKFMKIKSISGLIEIKLNLKKQKEEKKVFHKVSILKNKKEKVYKGYLSYLVQNKGYSLKQIKKMLNSKKNTVTKNMLFAIYADYTKNNEKEAKTYYEVVINNKLERFIKSTEGLYLADYAIRDGQNKLVLKILPKFSCQFMDEPEKNYCYYYRARALYNLGKEYEIPLNIVRYKIKEAKIFYNDIHHKKREVKNGK
jgi:hypothetical protein